MKLETPFAVRQVVVLIPCFNSRGYLDDCLQSLRDADESGIRCQVVVVDNASTDDSVAHLRAHYPEVDCVELASNRGFAGGNNAGWAHIQQHYPEADYLVLLNVDTVVGPGWLRPLVDYLEAHEEVGAVQPKLLLHPRTDRINTRGNRSHYLGFGMTSGYGELDVADRDEPGSIDFASGAAVMLRTGLLRQLGLFDEAFYMYLEDADLCWKLRLAGHDTHYVPASTVQHKYTAQAPTRYYGHLERNRWMLLLSYYRWRTLALLSPALLAMELGQLGYAVGAGLLRPRLWAWGSLLRPRCLMGLLRRRRELQRDRRVPDRVLMGRFSGAVHLPTGDPAALRWVANPLFRTYWAVARHLIRW